MTTLNIGKKAYDTREIALKLEHDIDFLETRIALLRRQATPNPLVLATYNQMLESRHAVLNWLNQTQDEQSVSKWG